MSIHAINVKNKEKLKRRRSDRNFRNMSTVKSPNGYNGDNHLVLPRHYN